MVWLVGVLFLAAVSAAYFFPRPQVAVLVVLVLFVGGVLVYAVYDLGHTRAVQDKITAEVVFDQSLCGDPAKPIGVTLHNLTGSVVTSVYFDLEAFRPGHSREALTLPSQISDRILADGGKWTVCVGSLLPPPEGFKLSELTWKVKVTSMTFQR